MPAVIRVYDAVLHESCRMPFGLTYRRD